VATASFFPAECNAVSTLWRPGTGSISAAYNSR
jgi:hypothetical protein